MPDGNLLIINIIMILAEVSLIIIVLYLLNWLSGKLPRVCGRKYPEY